MTASLPTWEIALYTASWYLIELLKYLSLAALAARFLATVVSVPRACCCFYCCYRTVAYAAVATAVANVSVAAVVASVFIAAAV